MSSHTLPPDPPLPASLLDRYLAGDATAEEVERVDAWRRANPARTDLTDALRTRAFGGHVGQNDVEQGWAQIRERALSISHPSANASIASPAYHQPSAVHRRIVRWVSVGAIVGAGIVAVGFLWRSGHIRPDAAPVIHYTTYATQSGQVARLTLADGSQVTLAPNSTFGVARDFAKQRTVTLTGQAYFEIPQSAGVPFLVKTGAVLTRVLGTAFDVKHYATDAVVRVAVTRGKVATGGRQAVVLTAGGIGHVTDSTAVATTVNDMSAYTGWTDGELTFRWTPVSEMLEAVGRWYGVRFELADSSLAGRHVTATFANGETRADALALLGTVLNVRMTFNVLSDGTTQVTLHRKSATNRSAPSRRATQDSLLAHRAEVGR